MAKLYPKKIIVDVDPFTGISISNHDVSLFAARLANKASYQRTLPAQRAYRKRQYWQAPDDAKSKAMAYHYANYPIIAIKKKEAKFKHRYNLTLAEQAAIIDAQGGICPVCKNELDLSNPRSYHTDHNHDTGEVRAVLCHMCNKGIGFLGDDIERIQAALDYLLYYSRKDYSHDSLD